MGVEGLSWASRRVHCGLLQELIIAGAGRCTKGRNRAKRPRFEPEVNRGRRNEECSPLLRGAIGGTLIM